MRLWRHDPATPEGKYPITLRRDGTALRTPYFTMTLIDPCAPAAFRAYANEAERLKLDPAFVKDMRDQADEAERLQQEWVGDPDAPRHRTDDPIVLACARKIATDRGAERMVADALAIVAAIEELISADDDSQVAIDRADDGSSGWEVWWHDVRFEGATLLTALQPAVHAKRSL